MIEPVGEERGVRDSVYCYKLVAGNECPSDALQRFATKERVARWLLGLGLSQVARWCRHDAAVTSWTISKRSLDLDEKLPGNQRFLVARDLLGAMQKSCATEVTDLQRLQ